MKNVLVLGVQVPFVKGGARLLQESLVREINNLKDVNAELVVLPFKGYPEKQILNDIIIWRLLDLSESYNLKIDLVVATKFPSYAAEHSNKVLWLVHQHRLFYDLANTVFDCSENSLESNRVRSKVRLLDNQFIKECKKVYTISQNVSDRLKRFNMIESETLYPPSPYASKIEAKDYYGNKIVYIGRIDPIKRIDLLIRALEFVKGVSITIIGSGNKTYQAELLKLSNDIKVADRCDFLGYLSEQDMINHLSKARAVFYAPFDEDFGYATIEGFLAQKPIITCDDSGEVTTLVLETQSGLISSNNPKEIAENIKKINSMTCEELKRMALNGYNFAKTIKWESVLEKLVLENI